MPAFDDGPRGALVAFTYRATIDQPQRFVHSMAVGAHVRLTPRRHQSGEIDYDGGIVKSGDSLLRTMLYEAAQVLLTQTDFTRGSSLGDADCAAPRLETGYRRCCAPPGGNPPPHVD